MISLVGCLSLVSALVATSDALSCTQCESSFTSGCTVGTTVTCPSGSVCGSVYTEAFQNGIRTTHFVRSCTPSSQCNIQGSITIKEGLIRMATSCCSTDLCSSVTPTLPTKNTNPNGLVCRSCQSQTSAWCYTSDTLQCTGDENMCLLQTVKVTGAISGSSATRGCATKSICNLGSQSQNVGDISTEVKHICTNGGISVHKVVLTPAIVCLLLLKSFF